MVRKLMAMFEETENEKTWRDDLAFVNVAGR
jgi:hypothetical protein